MNCKKCGNELKEGENFCSKCGKSVNDKPKKKYIIIGTIIIAAVVILIGGSVAVPKIINYIAEQRYQQEMQLDLENIDIQLKQEEIILPYQGNYNEGLYENQFNIDLENIEDYTKYESLVESYNGGTLEITGNININAIGKYEINYKVTSEKGNSKTSKIDVEVKDFMRPEIYIENETITIKKGQKVNVLEGVTAEDNIDNKEELTAKITTEGTVDVDKVGKYTIKYKVTDSSGWSTERTRTYKVIEKQTNIILGKQYCYTEYGSQYYNGSVTLTILFESGNKIYHTEPAGMEGYSYEGTYTIKDGIITANVETNPEDVYLGGVKKTLNLKIQDENTIKDLNTGYVYKTK